MNGQRYADEESLNLQIRRRSKDQVSVHVEVKGPPRNLINEQAPQRFKVNVTMDNVCIGRKTPHCCVRNDADGTYKTDVIKIKDGFPYNFECTVEDTNQR